MIVDRIRCKFPFISVVASALLALAFNGCESHVPPASRTHEAFALLDSVRSEHRRGNVRRAAELMSAIRSIPAEQLTQDLQTTFDHMLAGMLFDAEDYASCLTVIACRYDASEPDEPPAPGTALLIAHTLKKLGDTALAIEWYRLAELQISSEIVADINRNLAWLFAGTQQYDSAWARYHRSQALREPRESSDINGIAWWHFITGRLHAGTGNQRVAHREISKGLAVLEQLRTSLTLSEVEVRKSLLTAVATDITRHAASFPPWYGIRSRIDAILREDTARIALTQIVRQPHASGSYSSITPFSLNATRRQPRGLSQFAFVTDAARDSRGWLWFATLDGLYVLSGTTMLPVGVQHQTLRGPIRTITFSNDTLIATRFNGHASRISPVAPQPSDSLTNLSIMRTMSWRFVSTLHERPTAIATIPSSDSLVVVYRNGYAVVRSLDEPHSITPIRTLSRNMLPEATSAAYLDHDTVLVGTVDGLWILSRSSHTARRYIPAANTGLFASIENVCVLPNRNVAVSSSAVYTVVLDRANLNTVLWSGEESTVILQLATTLGSQPSLTRSLDRMRTYRAHVDIDRIPPRLRYEIGGSRVWKPSRSIAVLNSKLACFLFPGHIGIIDETTSSAVLHSLPSSPHTYDASIPRAYRLNDSTVVVVRDSSVAEGRITQPSPREGMTLIAVRAGSTDDFSIMSDRGVIHLPADQRSLDVAVSRPRSYASIDIPTQVTASWSSTVEDVALGTPVTYNGLSPGTNNLTFASSDIPSAASLTIIVDPMLTETWWFWTIIPVSGVALVILSVLYWRQLKRYRTAELERTAMLERVKIGQDLHDAVGADLVRINMILNRPDTVVPRDELARIAREANRTLRDIIWTSSAPQTADAVVAQIVERMRAIALEAGIELELAMDNEIEPHPMQASLIRDLVLVVTECITNIIKHANATVIHAYISSSASALHIVVSDNGVGFDVDVAHQGMGLPGMRQRAVRSGMDLILRSVPNEGSVVELIVSFQGVS